MAAYKNFLKWPTQFLDSKSFGAKNAGFLNLESKKKSTSTNNINKNEIKSVNFTECRRVNSRMIKLKTIKYTCNKRTVYVDGSTAE